MPVVEGSEPIVSVMKSTPWFWNTGHASMRIWASSTNSTSIVNPRAMSSTISRIRPVRSRSRRISDARTTSPRSHRPRRG